MFSGTLSFLCMKEESDLEYLDLSNNLFSGRISDCWSKNRRLSVINLENNNLSGIIPSSLGSVEQLQSLRLRNTSLYGEIPNSLQNCTQLKLLDMGENKLTGVIPSWIGERLQSLIVFRLRSNEFHGDLPSTICQQQFLQVLDLSLNNISGTIPFCLNNFTAMAHLGSSTLTIQSEFMYADTDYTGDIIYLRGSLDDHLLVIWKGVEQKYGKTLRLLKVIDLSCNKLSGEIPKELATLQGVITLNLSRNMLKGSIIGEIGQFISLESLDLSANHLFGEIPQSLSRLSFLSVLDLSNNNLSGKIPLGTQLQSINATSYSENPGLCGAPLRECPGDETPNPPNTGNTKSDEESFEPLWFFTGMTAGFLIRFWGIFGSLLVNRSWRHIYFQMVNKSANWIRLKVALNMAKLHRIL
ncbi:hypothetical protein V6N12_066286 [Hibiscus sabdariffa]|uniref:Uncharacterized protein n=1 Tax=Hibiscus sabdariffa TaxID=183260 RepID=A0ABR2CPN0_9ROSI